MEFENGFPPDDMYAAEYVDELHPSQYDPYWGYSKEDYEAWLAEKQADLLDQQKEANLVNWGSESLDDVDHDQ